MTNSNLERMSSNQHIPFSHHGIQADVTITDEAVAIDVSIRGWVRKRRYQLIFAASDVQQLRAAFMVCMDASLYQELPNDWIRKVENLSWRLFGFQRTHSLGKEPELPVLPMPMRSVCWAWGRVSQGPRRR